MSTYSLSILALVNKICWRGNEPSTVRDDCLHFTLFWRLNLITTVIVRSARGIFRLVSVVDTQKLLWGPNTESNIPPILVSSLVSDLFWLGRKIDDEDIACVDNRCWWVDLVRLRPTDSFWEPRKFIQRCKRMIDRSLILDATLENFYCKRQHLDLFWFCYRQV